MDKLSYALGLGIGQNLLGMGAKDMSVDDFAQAVRDVLQGKPTAITHKEAQEIVTRHFQELEARAHAANIEAGRRFLEANKQRPGVVTLPSGLQYKVLVRGEGPVAAANDEVTVKYEGRLVDGTVFDSSYERKEQTNKFRPSQVIKGWAEALTMMPAGSKWELYIPYDLAYGERAAGKIKPYSALVFTVELVSVNKAKAAGQGAAAKAGPATVKAAKIRPAKTSASKAQPNK